MTKAICFLIIVFILAAIPSMGSQCLGFYDAHLTVNAETIDMIRARVKKIDARSRANARMPELKSLIEKIFHTRFPAEPKKFKTKADRDLSTEIHTQILDHFKRLQVADWPYREMHYFFYVVTRYNEAVSHDMPALLELTSSRSLSKALRGTEESIIIEDILSYFPQFLVLPYAHLGSIARMNELGGEGTHIAVVMDRLSNIDGNPYESPTSALGHDYGHFQLLNKNPDLVFWKKTVKFINSQTDPISREAMHAVFFHIWHELPIQINARHVEHALTTGGLSDDAYSSMKKSQYGRDLKRLSQRSFDQSLNTLLNWIGTQD